jgi:hypothetical protein
MTTFPGSPRVLKGGIVLVNPVSGQVLPNGVIVLQYNPDMLSRTLRIKRMEEGADRSEVLRLKGPPVETIKLDAEIDATDRLGSPDPDPKAVQNGISPQLAALELLVYPTAGASKTISTSFSRGHWRSCRWRRH